MAYNNYFPIGYQNPYYQPNVPPIAQPAPQGQQQGQGVVWVQGIEGAKAHPVAAGQAVLLMDSDADCMYLKSADATGMPSLRIFDYKERTAATTSPKNADLSGFITKEDILPFATKDDVKKAISDLEKKLKGKKKDE